MGTLNVGRSKWLPLSLAGAAMTLSGCAISHYPQSHAELANKTCVSVLTYHLNCENIPLAFSGNELHYQFEQQMLPVHLREDVQRTDLEDSHRRQ